MGRHSIKSISCPRHGTKYIKCEGSVKYCAAPTPGEMTEICFYHPSLSTAKQSYEKKSVYKPKDENRCGDVMKSMFGDPLKRLEERRKKYVRTEIQPSAGYTEESGDAPGGPQETEEVYIEEVADSDEL